MISFRSAAVTAHDGTAILHPFSLTITEQRVSVIGANGSGKSTLARLINGLIAPTSGSVSIASGSAASELDTVAQGGAVRRAVGFVFSDPGAQLIMPTVREDMELSLRRHFRHAEERSAAALQALARFGLDGFAERSVHALSGGQQQLLAIAAVLATDPEILVADEPTTLLDLSNTRAIGDLLFSLPQQLVLVTHNLELAARADRTLVVANGRIVCDAEPAEAIAHYRASVDKP